MYDESARVVATAAAAVIVVLSLLLQVMVVAHCHLVAGCCIFGCSVYIVSSFPAI